MTQLDATLAALADPHRRGVVDLLRRQPRRAGDLADELGMSRPAMSRHLKVLRRTGLIEPAGDAADARARIYRLKPEPFTALRRWLDDVERFWSHELEAFRAHVEARAGSIDRGSGRGSGRGPGRAPDPGPPRSNGHPVSARATAAGHPRGKPRR